MDFFATAFLLVALFGLLGMGLWIGLSLTVVAWLGMNAFLLAKGYPLLCAEQGDQALVARLLSGPPPLKIVQFEARVVASVGA